MMTVCEWLEQVRMLDELISSKLAERDQVLALATKVSVNMDGMPHVKGGVSDPVGTGAAKLVMLAQETDELIDKYVDYKAKVVAALEKLPPNEYGALHRHYIQYMKWEDVAQDMGYSTVQVWRFKTNGLKLLEDVMECYIVPMVQYNM